MSALLPSLVGKAVGNVEALAIGDLLQRYDLDYLDVLKIDIEGAEKELFENAANWIEKVGVIMIELHEGIKPGCVQNFNEATRIFEHRETKGENTFAYRQTARR